MGAATFGTPLASRLSGPNEIARPVGAHLFRGENEMETKVCSWCKQEKTIDAFGIKRGGRYGRRSICRQCRKDSGESSRTIERAREKREATFATRHPQRLPKSCLVCGVVFTPRRAGGSPQIFCSSHCKEISDGKKFRAAHPGRTKEWFCDHPGYSAERCRAKKEALAARTRPTVCEVCGSAPTTRGLHFDHDHKTGLFRGWLCHGCNIALGSAKDKPEILRKLAEYLERGGV